MSHPNKTQLSEIIKAGSKAPSGGNIQPWMVKIEPDMIRVSLNPERSGNWLDVDNLGSIFSLGCFSINAQLKAFEMDIKTNATINSKDNHNFTFSINFGSTQSEVKDYSHLSEFIETRKTNRKLHLDPAIDQKTISEWKKPFANEFKDMSISIISDPNKKQKLAKVLGLADAFRFKHPELREEMRSEMRWSDDDVKKSKDGIDIKTLELPKNADKLMSLIFSKPAFVELLPNSILAKLTQPVILNSSHLCCLTLQNDFNTEKIFQAGRLTELLWLKATELGLSIHPWTVLPFFIYRAKYSTGFDKNQTEFLLERDQELRQVFDITSNYSPLFIFRLNRVPETRSTSLRLDLDQILVN